MNVILHIERLVLEGVAVAPGRETELCSVIEFELTKLIRDEGLKPSELQHRDLRRPLGRSISTRALSTPASLGPSIAASIYKGIAL
ncbi:conserved hypothetical protein [Rubrivivax sp. A210]|uniref:hypothetical protein n=1 Tax=Rubrivivax sp. A210 TaxID=2772301 RepID=UPI001917AA7D|nr:hypothetical protein [Rubrivivax sp. A210]CAD5367071.1 conserved hypothetical protein [Rubrivivax sp. A210]